MADRDQKFRLFNPTEADIVVTYDAVEYPVAPGKSRIVNLEVSEHARATRPLLQVEPVTAHYSTDADDAELKELRAEIEQKTALLGVKEVELTAKDNQIAAKDSQIAELETKLAEEREKILAEMEELMAAKPAEPVEPAGDDDDDKSGDPDKPVRGHKKRGEAE
jgi:hypothetical protein